MNRKLWIVLNLALACAVVWTTVELRDAWRAAKAHQAATLGHRVAALPMASWKPLPNPPITPKQMYR